MVWGSVDGSAPGDRGSSAVGSDMGAARDPWGSPGARRPNLLMYARRVFREIPRRVAVRDMFQFVLSSAACTCPWIASPSGTVGGQRLTPGEASTAVSLSSSPAAVTSDDSASKAARSMVFASSRTLPGQLYARTRARASTARVVVGRP